MRAFVVAACLVLPAFALTPTAAAQETCPAAWVCVASTQDAYTYCDPSGEWCLASWRNATTVTVAASSLYVWVTAAEYASNRDASFDLTECATLAMTERTDGVQVQAVALSPVASAIASASADESTGTIDYRDPCAEDPLGGFLEPGAYDFAATRSYVYLEGGAGPVRTVTGGWLAVVRLANTGDGAHACWAAGGVSPFVGVFQPGVVWDGVGAHDQRAVQCGPLAPLLAP